MFFSFTFINGNLLKLSGVSVFHHVTLSSHRVCVNMYRQTLAISSVRFLTRHY